MTVTWNVVRSARYHAVNSSNGRPSCALLMDESLSSGEPVFTPRCRAVLRSAGTASIIRASALRTMAAGGSAADGDWDLLVEVGYPTPAGYDDPATQAAFGAIRAAHKLVPVEGKTLRELGTILGTERLPVLTGTR